MPEPTEPGAVVVLRVSDVPSPKDVLYCVQASLSLNERMTKEFIDSARLITRKAFVEMAGRALRESLCASVCETHSSYDTEMRDVAEAIWRGLVGSK